MCDVKKCADGDRGDPFDHDDHHLAPSLEMMRGVLISDFTDMMIESCYLNP